MIYDTCECGKKLNKVKRFCRRWFTKKQVYVVSVVNDKELEIERFPVCDTCAQRWITIAELVNLVGEEKALAMLKKARNEHN